MIPHVHGPDQLGWSEDCAICNPQEESMSYPDPPSWSGGTGQPIGTITSHVGGFDHNSFTFTLSRPAAVAQGFVEPTDEERQEEVDRVRVLDAFTRAVWGQWSTSWPALQAVAESSVVATAVMRRHAPTRPHDRAAVVHGLPAGAECSSCTAGEDAADWPCQTVLDVAEALGVHVPDQVPYVAPLPFGPVPDPLPWPRPTIRDLFPVLGTGSSFIDYQPPADE